ncbi:MAG: hypothetical protein NT052_02520, partial [Candidatus Shapirobacteria bacterium]|nr:hypothetical protein [Candidatus Shapirobacteria bacterium]
MTGLFCSSPRVQKKLQKWFSSFAIFSLFLQIFSGVFAYQPVIAEEGTEIPQETVIVSENTPTPEVTPNSETTPIIEAPTEVIPTPVEEVTPTPIIEENVPPAENSAPPNETSPPLDLEKPIEDPSSGQIAPIPTQAPSQWTFEKVELDKEYIAPQNSGVKLTFTGLPNPSGNIKIEEITLTSDQIKQTGSLSDKAYDITSDMKDGDFTYNLSLPIPESSKGEAVEVKSAEELSNIGSAAKVENTLTKTDTSVSVTSLDHFTIFVVFGLTASATMILVDSLQANWGTGVYSAYYTGPYASRTVVSPGDTTVYGGREAGIIKAGFVTAEPWDEGILAFKVPNVAISTFAGQVLAYDVQNESGSNPVWVRIRLVGGTQYQFVPSSYSAGVWNTVNAATGEWQLMDGDGNATGSLMTLSGVATANPGAQVDRVYLTLGMGNSYNVSPGVGTVGWVDKVTIGGITYDFITTGEIP